MITVGQTVHCEEEVPMQFSRTLGRKISSAGFDANMGQMACWIGAICILVLGFIKLTLLPLTETELFFGLLLVIAVAQLQVTLGMLIRVFHKMRQRDCH